MVSLQDVMIVKRGPVAKVRSHKEVTCDMLLNFAVSVLIRADLLSILTFLLLPSSAYCFVLEG